MPSHLPRQLRFSHSFCFFLHDQMVNILISCEQARLFDVRLAIKDPKRAMEIKGLSGEELFSCMERNGYKGEIYEMYYRLSIAALLADFLHFVFESLQCSRKGKLTVAFALLRKPFKDNLLYLEWLLADAPDFLRRFESDKSGSRFGFAGDDPAIPLTRIVGMAMEKCDSGQWIDPAFLYDLRYKKSAPYSLEPSWQKANHLHTSYRLLETEPANLNFIFSNEEDIEGQWEQYYSSLPLLLFHTLDVVHALIATIGKRDDSVVDLMPLRTMAGLILWTQRPPWEITLASSMSEFVRELEAGGLECFHCSVPYSFDKANLERFYRRASLRCRGCKTIQSLDNVR